MLDVFLQLRYLAECNIFLIQQRITHHFVFLQCFLLLLYYFSELTHKLKEILGIFRLLTIHYKLTSLYPQSIEAFGIVICWSYQVCRSYSVIG